MIFGGRTSKFFLELYAYSEQQKISLFNAHLGGEARIFVQEEDLTQITKVSQLNELMKNYFSRKHDWHNIY